MSFSVVTLIFKGVLPVLTALKVTFAKTMSPLTPPMFHADIVTIPVVLLIFHATAVESGPLETDATRTTAGSYVTLIAPVP